MFIPSVVLVHISLLSWLTLLVITCHVWTHVAIHGIGTLHMLMIFTIVHDFHLFHKKVFGANLITSVNNVYSAAPEWLALFILDELWGSTVDN